MVEVLIKLDMQQTDRMKALNRHSVAEMLLMSVILKLTM
jgi:hypothetical protein